ncbi:GGDEF domain-containing protein [Natronospira sp.]|uniref:GGDEF domain-containing protein n=1 Tax=Natronospira sp. TaxID=2024970 RepID=UPI003873B615
MNNPCVDSLNQPASHLLHMMAAAESPSGLIKQIEPCLARQKYAGISGVSLQAGPLGNWSHGDGGGILVDGDLLHAGRSLGRLRVFGDEHSEAGQSIRQMAPLLIASAARLLALHEAERRAMIDPLTGVLNRHGLEVRLAEEAGRARRNQLPLSVLMIDVDHLKDINDQMGHGAGDRSLRSLADVLTASVRGSDQVARWGGDEFMVLLPETDLEGGRMVAARIRRLLSKIPAAPMVSIGLSEMAGTDSIERMVSRADQAMYRVKKAGRDGVSAA